MAKARKSKARPKRGLGANVPGAAAGRNLANTIARHMKA